MITVGYDETIGLRRINGFGKRIRHTDASIPMTPIIAILRVGEA